MLVLFADEVVEEFRRDLEARGVDPANYLDQ
ncbi:hypothetical protein Ae331Ps2_0668 [Pseudonocardia sp. Ae331_Ps2]|nr:hypothetical protein Ae331Ps2_0668 [Pseudonocardia sp. Ae331_Ps2]